MERFHPLPCRSDHGDQEEQHEDRTTIGGNLDYKHAAPIFGLQNDVTVGLATRSDFNDVSRLPTEDRIVIPASEEPLTFSETDTVRLSSFSAYVESATRWTDGSDLCLAIDMTRSAAQTRDKRRHRERSLARAQGQPHLPAGRDDGAVLERGPRFSQR